MPDDYAGGGHSNIYSLFKGSDSQTKIRQYMIRNSMFMLLLV